MKVRIKTSDWNALNYETLWAAGFDFKCTQDYTFEPWDFILVETWTVVEIPKGYMLQIQPRSSTYKKHGLMQANGVWIIDSDYCGDTDTIKFGYINMSKETQFIEKGTRIGQWVFIKVEQAEFEVVEKMENDDRWGFWTTWIK
jgi:dUTP pyrophosphatase